MKYMNERKKTPKDLSKQSRPNHSERGHHPHSPSNFPKWEKCPKFENDGETRAAASRGTMLHEWFEKAVRAKWKTVK
jgi:hypothetical protein